MLEASSRRTFVIHTSHNITFTYMIACGVCVCGGGDSGGRRGRVRALSAHVTVTIGSKAIFIFKTKHTQPSSSFVVCITCTSVGLYNLLITRPNEQR